MNQDQDQNQATYEVYLPEGTVVMTWTELNDFNSELERNGEELPQNKILTFPVHLEE